RSARTSIGPIARSVPLRHGKRQVGGGDQRRAMANGPNLPAARKRPNGMERLMRATIDLPARPDSTESATAALASALARPPGLPTILFREDQPDSDPLAAILFEVAHGFADRYPPIQIDVRDQPQLAALYNVGTTPTILLVKDGMVVDRVVGTPTRILMESL